VSKKQALKNKAKASFLSKNKSGKLFVDKNKAAIMI
jgi:hypothetical protein